MTERRPTASGPHGLPIVVYDRPMVFWNSDHRRTQFEALERIDTRYFRYLAGLHGEELEDPDSTYAGVVLRMTYSHAMECLFALIGASLQAPRVPAGWLLKYRYSELRKIVEHIEKRELFENHWTAKPVGWPDVLDVLMPRGQAGNPQLQEHFEATLDLWQALSLTMLDDDFEAEYMSLEHGFRVGSGEWFFGLRAEEHYGVASSRNHMYVLADSRHGSTFYRAKNIAKYHWAMEEPRVNWNPRLFSQQIPLIADSIDNVITFLRIFLGGPGEDLGLHLLSKEGVELAFTELDIKVARGSSFRFTWESKLVPEILPAVNHDYILDQYRKGTTYASRDESVRDD